MSSPPTLAHFNQYS